MTQLPDRPAGTPVTMLAKHITRFDHDDTSTMTCTICGATFTWSAVDDRFRPWVSTHNAHQPAAPTAAMPATSGVNPPVHSSLPRYVVEFEGYGEPAQWYWVRDMQTRIILFRFMTDWQAHAIVFALNAVLDGHPLWKADDKGRLHVYTGPRPRP